MTYYEILPIRKVPTSVKGWKYSKINFAVLKTYEGVATPMIPVIISRANRIGVYTLLALSAAVSGIDNPESVASAIRRGAPDVGGVTASKHAFTANDIQTVINSRSCKEAFILRAAYSLNKQSGDRVRTQQHLLERFYRSVLDKLGSSANAASNRAYFRYALKTTNPIYCFGDAYSGPDGTNDNLDIPPRANHEIENAISQSATFIPYDELNTCSDCTLGSTWVALLRRSMGLYYNGNVRAQDDKQKLALNIVRDHRTLTSQTISALVSFFK